jgi:hypothetical protein
MSFESRACYLSRSAFPSVWNEGEEDTEERWIVGMQICRSGISGELNARESRLFEGVYVI